MALHVDKGAADGLSHLLAVEVTAFAADITHDELCQMETALPGLDIHEAAPEKAAEVGVMFVHNLRSHQTVKQRVVAGHHFLQMQHGAFLPFKSGEKARPKPTPSVSLKPSMKVP